MAAEEIAYTESGNLETDLNAITSATDGLMDAVHARRNAVGADLVKLVVGNTAGGACGVAWLLTSLSPSYDFAPNAFSVTAYPCISPNYTFGHELGHNMGSNHAPEDGATVSLYPYSFGYKHPANVFRTVMAYNCPGSGCPRVLYFSNPSVSYSGLPTGTAAQHNNALSINNARTHDRELAAGGRRQHSAHHHQHRQSLDAGGYADIGHRLHRRRRANGRGQPDADGDVLEPADRGEHSCRAHLWWIRREPVRWSSVRN